MNKKAIIFTLDGVFSLVLVLMIFTFIIINLSYTQKINSFQVSQKLMANDLLTVLYEDDLLQSAIDSSSTTSLQNYLNETLGAQTCANITIYSSDALTSGGSSSSQTNTQLTNDDILADITGYLISYIHLGSQLKIDISSLPVSSTINSAELCLYLSTVYGILDNDIGIYYLANEWWEESDAGTEFSGDFGSLTNRTTTTLSSTSTSAYSCFDVSTQLRQGLASSVDNLSLVIFDPDNDQITSGDASHDDDGGDSSDLYVGDGTGGDYFEFDDREDVNKPYMDITYSTPSLSSLSALKSGCTDKDSLISTKKIFVKDGETYIAEVKLW